MGAEPIVSSEFGIVLCLTAAMMWGSWAASLKHLGTYTLDGFLVRLYISSFLFVWITALIVERGNLFESISMPIRHDPLRALGVLVGGAAFAIGMGVTLTVLSRIGLSIAQPIQSSVSMMLGTAITIFVGGVPEGSSVGRIVLAVSLFISAVALTMTAAWFRSRTWKTVDEEPHHKRSMGAIWASLPLIALACLLGASYPWALSIGLESPTQSAGMRLIPFMAFLVTGSLIGTLLMSGTRLIRNHQLKEAISAPRLVIVLAIVSGIFHYGGNIIHSIGTTALSASIAWPLGLSAALWTILWGLIQGEFKRAPRIAYLTLALAIGLYCIGVAMVIGTAQ